MRGRVGLVGPSEGLRDNGRSAYVGVCGEVYVSLLVLRAQVLAG